MSAEVPNGYKLVEVIFGDGPLGVTFRKNKETGLVNVLDIVKSSQAVAMDITDEDQVWAVGHVVLGSTHVDEDVWKNLLVFMKASRPLQMTLLRKDTTYEEGTAQF
jgi:hypothetical protein